MFEFVAYILRRETAMPELENAWKATEERNFEAVNWAGEYTP